jgi:hypothetical protein
VRPANLVVVDPPAYETYQPSQIRYGGWDRGRGEPFDLVVFEKYSPSQVPPVPSLSFAAVPPVRGLRLLPGGVGSDSMQPLMDWRRQHPVLRHVVLDDVLVRQPQRLVMPPEGITLASTVTGPVIAEVVDEQVRHVVTALDVEQTNWPKQIGFPVFISNVVQYLALGGGNDDASLAYQPGQVAVVSTMAGIERVAYHGPVDLTAEASAGRAVLPALRRAGLYRADRGVEPPHHLLAVNVVDPHESDLRPAERLDSADPPADGQGAATAVQRRIWHWFVLAALAVLMAEWIVYTRRMHL